MRNARLFRLGVWLTLTSLLAGLLVACFWSRIRVAPIFRIKSFQLVGCPEPGQPEMKKLLAPHIGRSVFDVPAIATHLDAKLRNLPELRGVRFIRHWPNEVEVRVKGREPVAVAQAGDTWLSVDAEGVGMRYYRTPPLSLMAVRGLPTQMAEGKPRVSREQLALTNEVRDAAKRVLGQPPRAVEFGDGGAVLARLRNGDTVRLGQVDQLVAKFQVYRAVRANHDQPVAYVDVSDPAVPALLAAPKPPPPAPKPEPVVEDRNQPKTAEPPAPPEAKPAPAKPKATPSKRATPTAKPRTTTSKARSATATPKSSPSRPKDSTTRPKAPTAKTKAPPAKPKSTTAKPKTAAAKARPASTKARSTSSSRKETTKP